MTRTDIHRPASPDFDPEAYDFYGCFDTRPEWPDPAARDEHMKIVAALVNDGYHFGAGSSGNCGHCGARIRYAALMARADVKEMIYVGETCLDNRFEMTQAEFRRLREQGRLHAERATRQERVAAFLAEHEGLEAALATDHYISRDLLSSLLRKGELSEKQIELAYKIARQEQERVERMAAREIERQALIEAGVEVPVGRVVVEGVVLTTKWVDNDFGGSLKMLVQAEAGWKVWGTVPSAIETYKGDRVRFTATIERSDDDQTFGFYKRPTKAEVLENDGYRARWAG
jgi:hypothetical protein